MFESGAFQQFIFSNQEDTYYLDSALGLKLEPYLWYQLRRQGKNVYFIRPGGPPSGTSRENGCVPVVRTFSRQTGQWEDFSPKKNTLFKSLPPEEALCDWMESHLKGNAQNVVVIPAGTFCKLYADHPERFSRLKSISAQERRGNMLIILCTVPESSRVSLFSDVQNGASGQLIPHEQNLYRLLRERMPHQVYTLNEPAEQELQAMLRRIALEKEFARYGLDVLSDMAAYLRVWLGSARLREEAGIVCPDRVGSTRAWLWRILREREYFEAFRRAAQTWKQTGQTFRELEKIYMPELTVQKTDLAEIALDCAQKALALDAKDSAENFRRAWKLWELYRIAQEQMENPAMEKTLLDTRQLLSQANVLLNDTRDDFDRKIEWLRHRLEHNGQFCAEEQEVLDALAAQKQKKAYDKELEMYIQNKDRRPFHLPMD